MTDTLSQRDGSRQAARPAQPSGAELAAELRAAIWRSGRTQKAFLAPLTGNPTQFLVNMEKSPRPKPHTVARARALIDDEPLPVKPREMICQVTPELWQAVNMAARAARQPMPEFSAGLIAMGLSCWEESA